MKKLKLEKLGNSIFRSLEANEMRSIMGGSGGNGDITYTEAEITIYSNGTSKIDNPANPNDGQDT